MKILKLLFLALSICIVVGLVIFFFDKSGPDVNDKMAIRIVKNSELQDFYNRYPEDWNKEKGWNQRLYYAHVDSANVYLDRYKVDEYEHEEMVENLSDDVLEKLIGILEPAYKAASVDEKEVEANLPGIDVLNEHLSENEKSRAKKMKDAWDVYKNTKAFVQKTYSAQGFGLGMSADGSSWTAFNSHKSAELSKRDGFLTAPLFKEYFSNNKMLNDGLKSVDSRVEACRNGYNSRIADAIVSKYNNVPTFNASQYISAMNNATTEAEWNRASENFDQAWDSFNKSYMNKRQLIGKISSKFNNEVSNSSLQERVSGVARKYAVPTKPAKPAKPSFNNNSK